MRQIIEARFRDERSIRAGLIVALTMFGAVAAFAYYSIVRMDASSRLVDHARTVQTRIAELDAVYARVRVRWRAYIANGNPETLADFTAGAAELPVRMNELQGLFANDEVQLANLREFRELLEPYLESIKQSAALKSAGKFRTEVEIHNELTRPRHPVSKTNQSLVRMAETEARTLVLRERADRRQSGIARLVLVAGTALSIAILVMAFFVLSRQMRQLKRAQQDISALNVELEHRSRNLESTNRELESFSYSVSHDLRAPLRAIDGYALMLEEDNLARLDETGRRHLMEIRAQAARMGTLIDDLLEFSRLARRDLRTATVDMNALVRGVVEELRSSAPPNTHIDVASLPDVAGDRSLLRQVWINLVGNALKYSAKRDRPHVAISADIDPNMAIYRVSDNGAGFDMEQYQRLFGVFQRLHSSKDFPGTGIGLAIVQRVVARHGGRVWAESAPDRGAVFYFGLPRSHLNPQ